MLDPPVFPGGDLIRVLVPRLPAAAALLPHICRIDASRIYSNYGPLSRESAGGALCYDGYAGNTKTALSRLDVLVVPSKVDGRPNVVMEAIACGLPVFGAPVGGTPELIASGLNGFLMGPEQHGGITEVLRRWVSDPASFAAMRSSSRTVAEARFDRRRMMDTYEAVFRGFSRPGSRDPSVFSNARPAQRPKPSLTSG